MACIKVHSKSNYQATMMHNTRKHTHPRSYACPHAHAHAHTRTSARTHTHTIIQTRYSNTIHKQVNPPTTYFKVPHSCTCETDTINVKEISSTAISWQRNWRLHSLSKAWIHCWQCNLSIPCLQCNPHSPMPSMFSHVRKAQQRCKSPQACIP